MDNQEYFSWRRYLLDSDLESSTKHVLLTLSCYFSEQGTGIYPSTRRLSRDCNLNRETVEIHLRKAKELGWISSRMHGYAGQRWRRTEYRLLIPKGAKIRRFEPGELEIDVDGPSVHDEIKVDGLTGEGGRIEGQKVDGPSVLNTQVEYIKEYTSAADGRDASGGAIKSSHSQTKEPQLHLEMDLLPAMGRILDEAPSRPYTWKKPKGEELERLQSAVAASSKVTVLEAWWNWLRQETPGPIRSFCYAVGNGFHGRPKSRLAAPAAREVTAEDLSSSDEAENERWVKEIFG